MPVDAPQWFEKYRIGVPLIDADHLSLFQEVARFQQCMNSGMSSNDLDQALTFLYKYVGAHFAREEQLMREKHYPKYAQHKAVHHHLKKVVYAVRKIFQAEPERVDKEKLHAFLNDWLRNHILTMDKALAPYIEGPFARTRGGAPDAVPALADTVEVETDLIDVVVQVPKSKKRIIERCAYVFTHATPEAHDLEDIATSATGMSLEEARELAGAVLKPGIG